MVAGTHKKTSDSQRTYTVGLLQGTAYSRLHAHLSRTLFAFDLSIPEWKLLGQVCDHDGVKLSQLAELLSYDPPMVTKLVKQLEKKGLVKRSADAADERAKIITITAKGNSLLDKIEPNVRLLLKAVLQGISAAELQIYKKVLATIVANTEA